MDLIIRNPELGVAPADLLTRRRYVLDVLHQQELALPWEDGLEAIARYTSDLLTLLGAVVLVTAGDGQAETAADRARGIARHGAELVVCLGTGQHISAQIRGIRAGSGGWGRRGSRRMAQILLDCVGRWTAMPSQPVSVVPTRRKDVRMLARESGRRCVLLECGYVTCPADCDLLQQQAFQLRCAAGLTESLLRYHGIPEAHRTVAALLEQYLEATQPWEAVQPTEAPQAAPEPAAEARPAQEPVIEKPAAPTVKPAVEAPAARKRPSRPFELKPGMGLGWLGQGAAMPSNLQQMLTAMPAAPTVSGSPVGDWQPEPDEKGERPDPMLRHTDGKWYSPRALAMLREQEAREERDREREGAFTVDSMATPVPNLDAWWSPIQQASSQSKAKKRKHSTTQDPV